MQALWKCKVFCMWTVIDVIHWVLGYTTYGETLVAEKYGVYEDIQTKTGRERLRKSNWMCSQKR